MSDMRRHDGERRWVIVSHDWIPLDTGGQTLVNRQVRAYASSMGQARLVTTRMNRPGARCHWSIEPVETPEEGGDGDDAGAAATP